MPIAARPLAPRGSLGTGKSLSFARRYKMHCPRDRSPLSARREKLGHSYRCSKCDGRWLSQGLRCFKLPSGSAKADFASALVEAQIRVTGLQCPVCLGGLNESVFTNTPVVWCPMCLGVWLTSGSIEGLQAMLQHQGGGPSRDNGGGLAIEILAGVGFALFH
jgi:Zn-finger nucleic acid-binding protein